MFIKFISDHSTAAREGKIQAMACTAHQSENRNESDDSDDSDNSDELDESDDSENSYDSDDSGNAGSWKDCTDCTDFDSGGSSKRKPVSFCSAVSKALLVAPQSLSE